MVISKPTYIGLRTYRLNPLTTKRWVGASGMGVPPALAHCAKACTTGISPTTISSRPRTLATHQPGVAPGISHRVLSQGITPTTVPGATRKNAVEPAAAVEVRIA